MTATFDFGRYGRPVTTTSSETRAAFNRGLVWLIGYNHEAAAEAFAEALVADPGCGGALWGLALVRGPNYIKLWHFFNADERQTTLDPTHRVIADAKALRGSLTDAEDDLIDALADRYPEDPEMEDYGPWSDAFSDAMRKVYAAHPDDLDVVTVFAAVLMIRTPTADCP